MSGIENQPQTVTPVTFPFGWLTFRQLLGEAPTIQRLVYLLSESPDVNPVSPIAMCWEWWPFNARLNILHLLLMRCFPLPSAAVSPWRLAGLLRSNYKGSFCPVRVPKTLCTTPLFVCLFVLFFFLQMLVFNTSHRKSNSSIKLVLK